MLTAVGTRESDGKKDTVSELLPDVVQSAETLRKMAGLTGYDPDNDFKALMLQAVAVEDSAELKTKRHLIGVPLVITSVTFRPGAAGDYASIEATIADGDILANLVEIGRLSLPIHVIPNERVVFNDSGTGCRRRLVQYFERVGMLETDKTDVDGDKPDTVFDQPYTDWKHHKGGAMNSKKTALTFDKLPDGRLFRYACLRGLRVSEYDYMGTPAETFYLA